MRRRDGHCAVIFNGEIYNYRELRDELRAAGVSFHTDSDTEVLLAAWEHWGEAALRRYTGMFAFALYDERKGELVLARDAFGIKPLYCSANADRILFGSEPAGLRALDPALSRLDWQTAVEYLTTGRYDRNSHTFFDDLHQVEPGCLARFDLHSGRHIEQRRWWRPQPAQQFKGSLDDAAAEFRRRFLDSVRLHLRSDVPLGAALSGGLDSSAIVCAMRHLEPDLPINTFSYLADGPQGEARWVELVNQHCGATAHTLHIGAADLARDIDALITTQGEPVGSSSIYAQYRVFQLARERGMVVTLEGQGADELLAGYHGYPVERVASLLEAGQLAQAWRYARTTRSSGGAASRLVAQAAASLAGPGLVDRLRRLSGRDTPPDWLDAAVLHEAGITRALRPARHADRARARGRRVIAALSQALQGDGLAALLRHGDRNAMRFSIESRVPFLTPDLADFLLGLPESYLVSPTGQTKHVMRAGLRGIVPDAILDRQDKIGFATPEADWMRQLAPKLRTWLLDGPDMPFMRRDRVVARFDAMMAGKIPFSWQAWRWVNFQRWATHNGVQY